MFSKRANTVPKHHFSPVKSSPPKHRCCNSSYRLRYCNKSNIVNRPMKNILHCKLQQLIFYLVKGFFIRWSRGRTVQQGKQNNVKNGNKKRQLIFGLVVFFRIVFEKNIIVYCYINEVNHRTVDKIVDKYDVF